MTTLTKKEFRNISIFSLLILSLILLVLLTSCSSRKVQIEKVKETTEISQVNKDKTETISNEVVKESTDTNNDVITETTEIVPIDLSKESFFITPEGKKIQLINATYKRIRTIDKSKVIQSKQKENKAIKRVQNDNLIRINKDVLHKSKETKRVIYWWFLLPLIIPIYYIYKKLNPSA